MNCLNENRSAARLPLTLCALLSCLSAGCQYSVKYTPIVRAQIEPRPMATSVDGSFEEAKKLLDQAELPHNSVRARWELQRKATTLIRDQLGSDDYLIIGQVFGEGDDTTTAESVKQEMCKRAAQEGGDVVFVIETGAQSMPFAYSTPSYSTTHVSGSAYGYGNYAYGTATARTTHSPGTTFDGVVYYPHASGFVLRHLPGMAAREAAIAALPDAGLGWAVTEIERLIQDRSITFEACLRQIDHVIKEAGSR